MGHTRITETLDEIVQSVREVERDKLQRERRAQEGAAQSERPGRIAGWSEYADKLKRAQSEWINGGGL